MKDSKGNKITEEEFMKGIGHMVEPPENIQKQCLVCGNGFITAKDIPHKVCASNKFCRFIKKTINLLS